MTLGEKISKLAEEKGITQRELADMVDVTEVSMSRFIQGNRMPQGLHLANLSKALGVSADYLISDDEPENKQETPKVYQGAFIEVHVGRTWTDRTPVMVNLDHVVTIVKDGEFSRISFLDDSSMSIYESYDKVKGIVEGRQ